MCSDSRTKRLRLLGCVLVGWVAVRGVRLGLLLGVTVAEGLGGCVRARWRACASWVSVSVCVRLRAFLRACVRPLRPSRLPHPSRPV